jgi:hypothetical protein
VKFVAVELEKLLIMDPFTKDKELEYELEELYTISKNWAYNLVFIEEEITALKKDLLGSIRPVMQDETLELAQELNLKMNRLSFDFANMHQKLSDHLKVLAFLVTHPVEYLQLGLIEGHAQLEIRNRRIFSLFIEIKEQMGLLTQFKAVPA